MYGIFQKNLDSDKAARQGINTSDPTEEQHVVGSERMQDGNEAIDFIIVGVDNGDGDGVKKWKDPTLHKLLSYGGMSITNSPLKLADSVDVDAGTTTTGDVTSTRVIDGVYLQVQETAKFDIQFTFTGLTGTARRCEFRGRYEGNPAHDVFLYQYNYDTTSWARVTAATRDFPSAATDSTLFFTLNESADYVSSGESQLRIYHDSSPNSNHNMYIDYIDLTESTVDMPTAGTFYQLTGLSDDPENNVTLDGSGGEITIEQSGDYELSQTISFLGTPDAIITSHLFIDGADDTPLWVRKLGSSGDVGSAGSEILKALTAGEVLSWRVASDLPDAYISALCASMTLTKVG